jgi:hypothetical protein
MDTSRTNDMPNLRDRLHAEAYSVDPRKVADAIVERLLATHTGTLPVTGQPAK